MWETGDVRYGVMLWQFSSPWVLLSAGRHRMPMPEAFIWASGSMFHHRVMPWLLLKWRPRRRWWSNGDRRRPLWLFSGHRPSFTKRLWLSCELRPWLMRRRLLSSDGPCTTTITARPISTIRIRWRRDGSTTGIEAKSGKMM